MGLARRGTMTVTMPDASTTSYDVLPYGDRTFPRTHPHLLATVAMLFGIAPAPPGRCRVLEPGCAGGVDVRLQL